MFYIDDDNTTTLTARAGTSGGGEGAPTLQSVEDMTAIIVKWNAVEYVYGHPVAHYQVWRLGAPG